MPDREGAPYQAGDVVLVPFPYTDLSAAKVRPAVVVSNGGFNAAGQDVILCGVTSNLSNSANSVLIGPQDLESGSLPRPSRVKVGKILTVQASVVRARLGRLNRRSLQQIAREMRTVLLSD